LELAKASSPAATADIPIARPYNASSARSHPAYFFAGSTDSVYESHALTRPARQARAGHASQSARRRKSCWDSWPGKVLGNAIAARRGTGRTRKTIQGTA